MTMKEDKTATKRSSNKENESVLENGKKKSKEEKPATKVVVRRLPPTMTEEQFKMQVAPLPDFDYFYFVPADMSLSPNSFCRAYINFMDQSDLFIFTQKFDGYVFIDSKGGEFPAVVEFAPFQRIPKIRPNRKKDPKIGTIEAEPVYIAFKERLEAHNLEKKATANAAKQHFFETSLIPEKKELNNTPLLDYIKNRRAERQKVRDEKREEKRKKDLERRKAKEEQKRIKKEDETSVVKTFPSPENSKPIQTNLASKPSKSNFVAENNKESEIGHKLNEFERELKVSSCITVEKQQIKKNVFELLCSSNKFVKSNNQKPLPTFFAKHKDIEQEILKSAETKNEIKNKIARFPNEALKMKNPHIIKNYSGSPAHLSESFERNGFYFVESNTRLKISNSPVYKREKPIILKSVLSASHHTLRAEKSKAIGNYNNSFNSFNRIIPVHQNIKKDEKTTDKTSNKISLDQHFSEEVFRKNLQKVVSGVLGSATVKSPRQNLINKPKVFMKRVVDGRGELCDRPGYNSPNFYLPPRAFGCGPSQSKTIYLPKKTISPSEECLFTTNTSRHLKRPESGKSYLPKFSLNLPPFSNKSVVYSKSEGNIEKQEVFIKPRISRESLKRKV